MIAHLFLHSYIAQRHPFYAAASCCFWALRTTHHKIFTRFMSHALVKFTPTGFSYSLLLLTTASCFSARLLPDTWIALASSARPEQ